MLREFGFFLPVGCNTSVCWFIEDKKCPLNEVQNHAWFARASGCLLRTMELEAMAIVASKIAVAFVRESG